MEEATEISRGKVALRLLENTLLVEAFESVEEKYKNIWLNSRPTEVDLREHAYLLLNASKELKGYLTTLINTGKMAATTQAQRTDQEQRERRVLESDGSPTGVSGFGNP